ncbi:MAG: hypothetical protein A2Y07_03415 [Planctomycetes bacterium GWF2_50_10]|nr:MAG: hypothetical protein A2Y07_03415 [Planctomycetes bacterium GWF2_50_10]
MATEVRLPKLGQTMEEGTVVRCYVNLGDKVSRDQVLYDIETDKATIEMEASADGYVKRILVEIGQTIPVGDAMMILGDKDEVISDDYVRCLAKASITDAVEQNQPGTQCECSGTCKQAAPTVTPPPPPQTAAPSLSAPAGAVIVELQQLGQTMEEGTIVNCHVKVGDEVQRGQVIFDVETDKATIEMESTGAGFVKAILVDVGQTVPVRSPVIILAGKDEQISSEYVQSLKGAKAGTAGAEKPSIPVGAVPPPPLAAAGSLITTPSAITSRRVFASPRAKMAATDRGIDLATIIGTGPDGRITEKDVLTAKASTSQVSQKQAVTAAMGEPKYKLGQRIETSKLQKIIAARMLQSKREIPCFYLNLRADMTDLVKYREHINRTAAVKVSFNDFIIKAMAMALKQFPIMTGQLVGDHIQLASQIGVGLAIAVEDGLIAPILKNVDQKSLQQIAADSKAIIEKAKANKLSPADLEGGTITLSNLGAFGIESFIPIVVPGQCSILGAGKISDTCIPMDGNIMIRKLMSMTLAVDHKVANGAYAAQFLDYTRKLLEDVKSFE